MMKTNSAAPSFFTLAAEFVQRQRAEGSCSVEQFAEEFPHLRDEILDEFPGLLVAEALVETVASVALPERLGRYKVGREIGRGAMGIVVSATNPDLESEVAIKLLPFERNGSMEMLKRFHQEAKVCAAMDHPNIVPVFDYGTDENFAYLVMRKVLGKSLEKVITGLAKHSVPDESGGIEMEWDFVTSIGIQVAEALHYAHEQGVIHRDVKPANLILEPEGRLWVSDFGLSKVLGSDVHLSMTGDVLGTPKYMAPEQLRGINNPCSDVYSLGMTLFELVAVQPIWDPGYSSTQLLANKTNLALPDLKKLNPAVPDALCEVIMQAVELNPKDRFTTASELSTALKQSVKGTFIGDRRINDRAASRRSLIRNLAFAGCVGVVASASVYMLGPNLGDELARALKQPDRVREIFDEEKSRQVLMDKMPELLETAVTTDDKKVRALFADFATVILEPSSRLPDDTDNKRKPMDSGDLQQLFDAYVESGIDSPDFHKAWQANKETETALGRIRPEALERVRNDVRASDMSEEGKEHALKQVARYQNAIDDDLLSKNQKWRIKNFLVTLLYEDINTTSQLSPEALRSFISVLENELNFANASVADQQLAASSNPTPMPKPPLSSPPAQDSPDLNRLLRQAMDDPRVSAMIDEVTNDPRVRESLNKAQDAIQK